MASGIYRITINKKSYIGSSCNLDRRKKRHLSQLKNNKHVNPHLQASFNKHGLESLLFEKIFFCSPGDLLQCEQIFIDSSAPEFNICKTAGSPMKDRKHSDETRAKISEAGKNISDETRAKLSQRMIGNTHNKGKKHPHSDETRAKLSQRMIGNTHNKGKKHPHSDETKANMRKPHKKQSGT